MKNKTTKIWFVFIFYAVYLLSSLTTKKIYYIATEHPSVSYYNKKYATNLSFSVRRYSRRDPLYYTNIYVETLADFDNNITVNFYAFQSPIIGPILMELHFKWCHMVLKDEIIGILIRKYLPPTCPTPKGIYKISNMTTAIIPSLFIEHLPFVKARLFMNATIFGEKLVEGYVDMEVTRVKL